MRPTQRSQGAPCTDWGRELCRPPLLAHRLTMGPSNADLADPAYWPEGSGQVTHAYTEAELLHFARWLEIWHPDTFEAACAALAVKR